MARAKKRTARFFTKRPEPAMGVSHQLKPTLARRLIKWNGGVLYFFRYVTDFRDPAARPGIARLIPNPRPKAAQTAGRV